MTARELFQAGKLNEAVQALSAELRENPADGQRRTFLFELLCFAGEYDRAEKQLQVLSGDNTQTGLGALLYRAALAAERGRQDLFQKKEYPVATGDAASTALSGTLNDKPFSSISDADPRIGPRLEVYAAGNYIWIPFRHIERLQMEKPKRLRDLLWVPTLIHTGAAFKAMELGEVLVPATTVFACRHENDAVRLGRETHWIDEDGVHVPAGQKMFLVDDEEVPILEVRKLEFTATQTAEAVQ